MLIFGQFWVIFGPFFGAIFLWQNMPLCHLNHLLQLCRSMQFTTAVVALANSEHLLANIFLAQPIVKNHTAEGLADALMEVLQEHGIQPSQLEGASFDGQYIRCSILLCYISLRSGL